MKKKISVSKQKFLSNVEKNTYLLLLAKFLL